VRVEHTRCWLWASGSRSSFWAECAPRLAARRSTPVEADATNQYVQKATPRGSGFGRTSGLMPSRNRLRLLLKLTILNSARWPALQLLTLKWNLCSRPRKLTPQGQPGKEPAGGVHARFDVSLVVVGTVQALCVLSKAEAQP